MSRGSRLRQGRAACPTYFPSYRPRPLGSPGRCAASSTAARLSPCGRAARGYRIAGAGAGRLPFLFATSRAHLLAVMPDHGAIPDKRTWLDHGGGVDERRIGRHGALLSCWVFGIRNAAEAGTTEPDHAEVVVANKRVIGRLCSTIVRLGGAAGPWRNALATVDIDLSVWRIHRPIAMSGGLFISGLLRETGRTLSEDDMEVVQQAHSAGHLDQIDSVRPLPGRPRVAGRTDHPQGAMGHRDQRRYNVAKQAPPMLGLPEGYTDAWRASARSSRRRVHDVVGVWLNEASARPGRPRARCPRAL